MVYHFCSVQFFQPDLISLTPFLIVSQILCITHIIGPISFSLVPVIDLVVAILEIGLLEDRWSVINVFLELIELGGLTR